MGAPGERGIVYRFGPFLALGFLLCCGCGTPASGWGVRPGPYVRVTEQDVQSKDDLEALLAAWPAGTDFRFAPGHYAMRDRPGPVLLNDADSGMTIEAEIPLDPPIFEGDPEFQLADGSGFLAVPYIDDLHGFTIRNVVMTHFDNVLQFGSATTLGYQPPGVVHDLTVEHSWISDFGEAGMVLWRCFGCVIRNNVFTSDKPQNGDSDAMWGGNADVMVIEGNVVDSQAVPLHLEWMTRALVVGNTFRVRQLLCTQDCGPPYPGSIGVVFAVDTSTFYGAPCPGPDDQLAYFDNMGSLFTGVLVGNDIERSTGSEYEPGWFCMGMVGPYQMQALAVGNRCRGFPESFSAVLQANHLLLADDQSDEAPAVDLSMPPEVCGPSHDNLALVGQQDTVAQVSETSGNLALTPSVLGADDQAVEDLVAQVEAVEVDPAHPDAAAATWLDLYEQLGRALCTAKYGAGGGAPAPCDAAPWAPTP